MLVRPALKTTPPGSPTKAARPLSLGVIFLTLYIDLVGFSIIFPLFPSVLKHYLAVDGQSGVLRWMIEQSDTVAGWFGMESNFAAVLFGGFLSSLYAFLQFLCAPMWGALSDRIGRRRVLLNTVLGTTVSYALWVFSGSFWLFIASRLIAGAFSGNISVATAAVADVTSRAERSKAMGLVGAAFGLGLVTGPAIGGFTAHIDLLRWHPDLIHVGINPFSVPALLAFLMSALNLVWVGMRFAETRPPGARATVGSGEVTRTRHPLRDVLALPNSGARRVNLVTFIYSLAFCGMEFSLTFLAADRFGYDERHTAYLMGFLGLFSILTQGMIVRRLLPRLGEIRVLTLGLIFSAVALAIIGLAAREWELYLGLAFVAIGSGLINPSTSGLISLYTQPHEQGRVLGLFRSLGSLARAVTPVIAGIVFWIFKAPAVFITASAMTAACLWLSRALPQPDLGES